MLVFGITPGVIEALDRPPDEEKTGDTFWDADNLARRFTGDRFGTIL